MWNRYAHIYPFREQLIWSPKWYMNIKTTKQQMKLREQLVLRCRKNIITCIDIIYTNVNGLNMDSELAPLLNKIWLSKYDKNTRSYSAVSFRYMDDTMTKIQPWIEEILIQKFDLLQHILRFVSDKEAVKEDMANSGYINEI